MSNSDQTSEISDQQLLQRISDAFFAVDNGWVITYWNQKMEDRTGKPSEEVIGEILWDVFPRLVDTDLEDRYRKAMQRKEPLSFEKNFDEPFNYWVEIDVYPDDDGLSIFSREITKRKNLQHDLEQAEFVFENSQDAIFLINVEDDKFCFERVNSAYENLTGLSREELKGKAIQDVFEPVDARGIRNRYQQCLDQQEPIKYVEQLDVPKKGSFWETRITPVDTTGDATQLVGSTRIITERKQQEQALRDIKQRLELVIDAANIGIWDWSLETDEVIFNDQWANMLGFDTDDLEFHFETWEKLLHPDDQEAVQQALKKHLEQDSDIYDEEIRLRTKDGGWKWIRTVGRVVERDDQGEPQRALGVHIDISKQKSMEHRLRESNHLLKKIVSTQELISESIQDRERLFTEIVNHIKKLTNSAGAVIEMHEDDQMHYRAANGILAENSGMRLDVDSSLSGICFQDEEMKRCSDVSEDERVIEAGLAREMGIGSMLMIPLQYRDQKFGVLKIVYSEPDQFDQTQEWIMSLIGGLLSSALWQSRQYAKLERQASTDKLTGLNNRREFLNLLKKEVERSRRYDNNLTLAILDIDFFKEINDTYGHPVGDVVLQSLSNILTKQTRKTDIVGRYGGEEFSILLPETSLSRAYSLTQRLRRNIEGHLFETNQGKLSITVSIGLSEFKPDKDNPNSVTRKADNALYVAKESGRNRVERRTEQRHDVSRVPVYLKSDTTTWNGWIVDISSKGLRVQLDDDVSHLDTVRIESRGQKPEELTIPDSARICWYQVLDDGQMELGMKAI